MGFTLIETQKDLNQIMQKLAARRVVAFDIECANSLHRYVNRVCLMQFFAGNEVFVVDVLADLDLAPVGRLLEDPAAQIVMHDTDFDLRSLDRDYGWHPKNLFDTLIAARLCGYKEFGLATLLEKYFGIHGQKKFQRADWTIRPIKRDMLEYAAGDVRELVRLRDILANELENLKRMEWAREEFLQCEKKRFKLDERPLFVRVKNARTLCDGRELAILKELAEVRDEIARALDLPHFKVIGDESLLNIAKRQPLTLDELGSMRGMHPACRGKYAELIVSAVKKGKESPNLKWPRSSKKSEHGYSSTILDILKLWRTDYAAGIGVDPDLVLSMDSIRRLAGKESIESVLQDEPIRVWRGEEISRALGKFLG